MQCFRKLTTVTQDWGKIAVGLGEKYLALTFAVLTDFVATSEKALSGTPAAEVPQAMHITRVLKIYIQGGIDPISLHHKFA